MKNRITLLFAAAMISTILTAQNEGSSLSPSASFKFINKFLFRGVELTKDPCIAGDAALSYKGFTFGVWAISNFRGTFFEPDFYLSYTWKNLVFMLYDFDNGAGKDFFNFRNDETTHIDELSVKYTVSEEFPLALTAGTCFWGADKQIDYVNILGETIFKDKNNFSTYLEAYYPFYIKDFTIIPLIGVSTHESYTYASDGFGLIHAGFSVDKKLRVTENFAVTINYSFVFNHELNQAHSLMSISF